MSALDKRQGQSQRQATRAAGGGGGGGNKKKPNRRDHGGGGGHRNHHHGGRGGGGKGDGKTPEKINAPKLPVAPGGGKIGLNLPNTGMIGRSPTAPGYSSLPLYSKPAAPSVLNTAAPSSNPFSLQAAANSAGGPSTPKPATPVSNPYGGGTPMTPAPYKPAATANPVTGSNPLAKAATSANPLAAASRTPGTPAAPGQPYGPQTGLTLQQQYRGTTPGGGGPYGGGARPIFSDKNDYEYQQFTDKPEEAYHALAQTAGINTEGNDTMGKWLKSEYQKMQMDYNALRTDSKNQNLSWFDFLGNLGGVPYGKPGWDAAFKKYLTGRYNNASMDARGLNYSPYEGQSRWLAIG